MGSNRCNFIQCECFFFEELNNNKFLVATEYKLFNIYPNPFNTVTMLNYAVPEQCQITISLYNMLGREVDRLYTGSQVPGYHSITWDAFEYSSGVYFVKMVAGEYVNIQKLVLVK